MPVPDFSPGEVLTAAAMDSIGMWLIKTQALSGVSTSVTDVFSSTYDSYKIVVNDVNNASATTRQINIRFRTTTDDTSANYFAYEQLAFGTTVSSGAFAGQTSFNSGSLSAGGNNGGSINIDVHNPNLAKLTTISGSSILFQGSVSAHVTRFIGGGLNTATQYTGFTIFGVTDALSGTVRVYGYRK